jgi:serine/threonine-protein kinase
MSSGETHHDAVRQQLARMLASAGFARNERLSRFLEFVVERKLAGKDDELKETLIAIEVFGRKPDYDPKLDSIVRTEAARLRARLVEFYAGEGRLDPIVIDIPKGGYTPSFRSTSQAGPPRNRRWLAAMLGAFAIALAFASGWWLVARDRQPATIAVLPFENLGAGTANDDFADGLTSEMINSLSGIDGWEVRSGTSSFAFKGKQREVHEAGRQLNASYILEGSVLRDEGKLRIDTQLVRVRDDVVVWSGRFDRKLMDVFAIQDEIARGIVNNLRLKLGLGQRRYETNFENYETYLRATALVNRINGFEDTKQESIQLFEQVVAADHTFAPAYAGLAKAYYGISYRVMDPDEAESKMRAAAEKAIALDPLLADAHDALGLVYARNRQWGQAEKSFHRAIELNPSRSTTYVHFARGYLWELGRTHEAVRQLRIAEKTDPLSIEVHETLAWVLISARQYDEAAAHAERSLSLGGPTTAKQFLARARFFQARTQEAIEMLQHMGRPGEGPLGYAYARTGRREEAEKLAAANADWPNRQVLIYAGLGDKDRAFQALEGMVTARDERTRWYLTYPELDIVQGDPRLKTIRKEVGLPD